MTITDTILEAKTVIANGADRAGWTEARQIDIMAAFINSKDLEVGFEFYIKEQVEEELTESGY